MGWDDEILKTDQKIKTNIYVYNEPNLCEICVNLCEFCANFVRILCEFCANFVPSWCRVGTKLIQN